MLELTKCVLKADGHTRDLLEVGMLKSRGYKMLLAIMTLGPMAMATGCRIETHKHGKNDNVNIATPFGGMSVKTNDSVVQGGVGLSVYPGAQVIKKSEGKDHDGGAADVNLSFGSFHLGVKALSYQSADSPEKVTTFYRQDMAKYGTVILCRDHSAVGTPVRTQEGLGCDSDNNAGVHVNEKGGKDELKAGSKQHQHIVTVEPRDGGTKIGLVALELPTHFSNDDGDSKQ